MATTTTSPALAATPPSATLHADDLRQHLSELTPSARWLVEVLGPDAAAVLIQRAPGLRIRVPRAAAANRHGARRWCRLVEMFGQAITERLVETCPGEEVDVPVCLDLVTRRRDAWIRQRFDALTGPGRMSARGAIEDICLDLAKAGQALTWREVQKRINGVPATGAAPRRQPAARLGDGNAAQLDILAGLED